MIPPLERYYREVEPSLQPEPEGDLFDWKADLQTANDGTWPAVTSVVSERAIIEVIADGNLGYNHVPRLGVHPRNKDWIYVCCHSHDIDEGAPGQFARYTYSSDGGVTWAAESALIPSPDDMLSRFDPPFYGRGMNIMDFYPLGDKLYCVVEMFEKDFTKSAPNNPDSPLRIGLGLLAVEVGATAPEDKSTPVWIHNAFTGVAEANNYLADGMWIFDYPETRAAVPALPTYPQYGYDYDLRVKLFREMYDPKKEGGLRLPSLNNSNTGYNGYWHKHYSVPPFNSFGEGKAVSPFGYRKTWIYYKNNNNPADATPIFPDQGNGFKVGTTDFKVNTEAKFFQSSIPDCFNNSAMHTRFYVLDQNSIFITGNSQNGNRIEGFIAHAQRDPITGRFVVNNSDVRTIAYNAATAPVYSGFGKGGGPQHFNGRRVGPIFYVAYSLRKEEVYFQAIDLNATFGLNIV